MVAVFLRQPPSEHGAKERADIDAEVENLEGPVARAGLGGKSGAQNRNRGGLEQPRAESERQKPDDEPRRAGDEREGKVPAHQQPGAGKQGALGAQEPVADPATHKREKIEQAAVRADERGGLRLLHTEPTGG